MPLDEKCPQCGSNLVLKYGRFGEFTACSNYPNCKYVKQKTIGVKCPNCSRRRDRRAALQARQDVLRLQSLSRCDFVAWGKPMPEKCPDCGSPLPDREVAEGGPGAQCPNSECKYKKDLPKQEEVPAVG